MEQFIFNIIVSFLVGIPSGIVASYIFEKIKKPLSGKSDFELDIKIKFNKRR